MQNWINRRRAGALLVAVLFAFQTAGSIGSCAELSLDEAVAMALRDNPDVRLAVRGEEKAAAQLEGAKGSLKPSVSAGVSLGANDSGNGFSRSNSNSINMKLPLYTGGKNELNIAKAEETVATKSLNLDRTRENVRMNTVVAYYNVLQQEKTSAVDAQSVKNYEEHLANVEALYAAGSSPKVDLLRSQVELANARQTLIKSQNAYDVAVSNLKSIIKMKSEEPLVLLDDPKYGAFSQGLADCLQYAVQSRKDLEQYRIAVSQAEKDVEIARSDKRPTVSLSIGNSWDKQIFPDAQNHSLNANVSANWNLFDGNVTESNIKAAEIAVEEARLTLEKQTDAVELAVREYYLGMIEAEKRFGTTELAVQQAREDYYIASEKYKAGEGIMLDIIDAQLALSTAESNFIQAKYDYATNRVKLENAMGLGEGGQNEKG